MMMNKLQLTTEQDEILFGILLGDAHMETQNRGLTFRLKLSQSNAHKTYLFHLFEVFKDFTTSPPKCRSDTAC